MTRGQHTCEHTVFATWQERPCGLTAKYHEDGQWWCGHHAPSKVAAKQAARDDKLQAESRRRLAQTGINRLKDRVFEAALRLPEFGAERAEHDRLQRIVEQ